MTEGTDMVTIKVMWDEGADRALGLPAYATGGAAGADLRATRERLRAGLHWHAAARRPRAGAHRAAAGDPRRL